MSIFLEINAELSMAEGPKLHERCREKEEISQKVALKESAIKRNCFQ